MELVGFLLVNYRSLVLLVTVVTVLSVVIGLLVTLRIRVIFWVGATLSHFGGPIGVWVLEGLLAPIGEPSEDHRALGGSFNAPVLIFPARDN